MRVIKTVVMLLAVASLAVSGQAQVDLPFSDGFEAPEHTNGVAIPTTYWSYSQTAYATNSPTPKDSSVLAAYAPDGMSLALVEDSELGPYSNVWYHCYAKVNASHTNDPSVGDAVAAFFINGSRQLKAYSNDQWIVVSENVPTNDWLGFSVHLDFENEHWDLYRTADSYTHGDNLVKQNGAPMAFNAAYETNELTTVDISGETYIDSVVLAKGSTSVSAVGAVSPSNVNSSAGIRLTLDDIYTGVFLQYFAAGDRKMTGPLGDALKGMLVEGDQVLIFYPGSGWQTFERNGPYDAWTFTASGGVSADFTVTAGMAMFIRYSNDDPRDRAFITVFDGIQSIAGATQIYGTNDVEVSGWNMLAFPAQGTIDDLTLPGVANGDRIYVRLGSGWYYARRISGQWLSGGAAATRTFPAGTAFWYRRMSDGSPADWTY